MNVRKRGSTSLRIPDDESIPWTDPIALEGPSDETPVVLLTERPSCHSERTGPGAEHHQLTLKRAGKDFKLNIEDYVRPGRCYDLAITDSSNDHPTLSFQTDAALTPVPDEVPSLDGLPSMADPQTGIVIASLVDPSAKGVAAADSWKWHDGGREHELIFR